MISIFGRAIRAQWFVTTVFATWVFAPELRRIVDWQSSFHSLSMLAVLPLVILLPGVVLFASEWSGLGPAYQAVVRLWALGLAYAFLVAMLSKLLFPAVYQAALFGLPVLLGLFLMARPTRGNIELDYEKTAHSILWIAVISSLYGIAQFVAPTPWDVYWSRNASIVSQGDTVAFSFRIFGTLNSTGVFAQFLALAVIANLPRLKLSRWWLIAMLAPCLIALMLTEVRALWVTLVAGMLVYLILTPARRAMLLSLGAMTAAVLIVASTLVLTIGGADKAITTFTERIQSFGSLDSDSSAEIRGLETTRALRDGFQEPLGQGLGVLGQGGKLSDSGQTTSVDSGYLSRFVEMGVVGFLFYMAAILVGIYTSFTAYRRYMVARNEGGARVVAMAVALQAALIVGDAFADHHYFLPGLFFWYSLYYASAYLAPSGVRREKTVGSGVRLAPPRLRWSS